MRKYGILRTGRCSVTNQSHLIVLLGEVQQFLLQTVGKHTEKIEIETETTIASMIRIDGGVANC